MHRLKHMKDCLICAVESQIKDLHNADAKELGEAIDMIKDLDEAIYYCTIVKSMEESEPSHYYYTEPVHNGRYYKMMGRKGYTEPMMMYRDIDKDMGRMYYDEHGGKHDGGKEYPIEIRDYREGRSPLSRRSYMEAQDLHKDKAHQMQELEKYMRELSDDLTEMVEKATPEEKSLLSKKLSTLATKIV